METRKRNAGRSNTEILAILAMLGFASLGLDSFDLWSDARSLDAHRRSQAEAIARGQMEHLESLPFESLTRTNGFVAAPWLHQPGFEPGEYPAAIRDGEGQVLTEHVYRVSLLTEFADPNGVVRKLALRVEWDDAAGETHAHRRETLRFR